jgi:acyl-coenzyme A synthetase/AMP-(fatty) acid ligase
MAAQDGLDVASGDGGPRNVARNAYVADEVMTWVAERVAPHKKVRAVEFVDELPKSATGKLLRRVFIQRERVAAGH